MQPYLREFSNGKFVSDRKSIAARMQQKSKERILLFCSLLSSKFSYEKKLHGATPAATDGGSTQFNLREFSAGKLVSDRMSLISKETAACSA